MSSTRRLIGNVVRSRTISRCRSNVIVSTVAVAALFARLSFGDPAVLAPPEANKSKPTLAPEDLYEKVAPSVVTIRVMDELGRHMSSGSGFFIEDQFVAKHYRGPRLDQLIAKGETEEGRPTQALYILTNYHVIRGAVYAEAVLSNGKTEKIDMILADDEKLDLALLSLDVHSAEPIGAIPFAKADARVLSTVYAIGSPKGFRGSASDGKVSGYREIRDGERWIQTTAPISSGSSGGPLVSSEGEVVGVTTIMLRDAQNINFAIPASAAVEFLTNTRLVPRTPGRDSSIRFRENEAFNAVHWIVTMGMQQHTDEEKKGALLLSEARASFDKAITVAEYERAITLARQAQRMLPESMIYLSYYLTGMAEEQICWTIASDASSKGNESFSDALEVALKGPHGKAAVSDIVLVTKLDPEFMPGWYHLAECYASRERWADALTVCGLLVSRMPCCARAFAIRGDCYFQLNLMELAKSDKAAAVDLDPFNGKYQYRLARILSESGDTAASIKSYQSAIDLGYDSATVHFWLGQAYKKAGSFDKAIISFKTAKELKYPAESCDFEIAACKAERN